MPFVLMVFELLVQPILIPRYAIAGVAGLVPLLAVVIHRASRGWQTGTLIALFALAIVTVAGMSRSDRNFAARVRERDAQARSLPAGEPVVFSSFDEAHYVDHLDPTLPAVPTSATFDLLLDRPLTPAELCSVRVNEHYAALFSRPAVLSEDGVRAIQRFHVIGRDVTRDGLARRFPDFEVTAPAADVFTLTRR